MMARRRDFKSLQKVAKNCNFLQKTYSIPCNFLQKISIPDLDSGLIKGLPAILARKNLQRSPSSSRPGARTQPFSGADSIFSNASAGFSGRPSECGNSFPRPSCDELATCLLALARFSPPSSKDALTSRRLVDCSEPQPASSEPRSNPVPRQPRHPPRPRSFRQAENIP